MIGMLMTLAGSVEAKPLRFEAPDGTTFIYPTDAPEQARAAALQARSDPAQSHDGLEIQYLGSGGATLRYGDCDVLTAPYWSNHGFLPLASPRNEVTSRSEAVEAGLVGTTRASIDAILSGHNHYDHVVDVLPAFTASGHLALAAEPILVANQQTCKILGDDVLGSCLLAESYVMGLPGSTNSVRACGGQLLIKPLPYYHAPNMFSGPLHMRRTGNLTSYRTWPGEGDVQQERGRDFAFLLTFLDGAGKPAWTVLYTDAASDSPLGAVPDEDVDVALLTVANSNFVYDYPRDIISLSRVDYTIGIHYESFFNRDPNRLEALPFVMSEEDYSAFLADADEAASRTTGLSCGRWPETTGIDSYIGPRVALPVPGEMIRCQKASTVASTQGSP